MSAEIHSIAPNEAAARAKREEMIATAVATLREQLPDFILITITNDQPLVISACTLEQARTMLDHGIRSIADQYAYEKAKGVLS